jgi:cleavage stimulation factor subunit 3
MEDAEGQYNTNREEVDNSDSDYEPTDNPPFIAPFVADTGVPPTDSRKTTPLNPLSTQPPATYTLANQTRNHVSTGFLVDEDDTPVESAPIAGDGVNASSSASGGVQRSASQTSSASMPTNVLIQSPTQDNVSRSPPELVHSFSSLEPSSTGVLAQDSSATMTSLTLPLQQSKASASVHVQAVPKARLPHDVVGILEDRIKEDPRGDMDAWLNLISEHRRRNKFLDVRKVFERFFKVFPSAVSLVFTSAFPSC